VITSTLVTRAAQAHDANEATDGELMPRRFDEFVATSRPVG
jgi:hypothetical protein